ncbi:hypothetical protein ACCT07_02920 [Rhizobium johnstonii]|uniref:hypothetical protein n=1 Tax=Rhizobium johnstonii TaxID=3019933 RepID=UPI003F9A44AE
MLVKTVTTVVATDTAGKPVDAIPVRSAVAGETDAAGRPVTPIPVTEDPLGVPVRVVVGKAAQNSAGQWVDTLPISGGGPPPWIPDANRYMPAATGIHWSQGFTQTYASGLNYQCSKLFFGSPDYPTNNFLVPFLGFGLTDGGNAPQETINPNANIIIDEAWFVHPNGTEYQILFGGNPGVTVTAATGVQFGQVTLPADLPAWSVYGIRTVWHGTVGNTYIGGYRCQRHRGEKYWAAGDLASIQALAAANGASTADRDPDARYNLLGNVSTSQPLAYGPAQIFAKGWDGRPVAMVLSDSLVERQELAASADARRNMGVLGRYLDKDDDFWGSTPHIFMGLPGAKSSLELSTSSTLRWNFIDTVKNTYNGGLDAWTFVLDQSGRNNVNVTASTWANDKLGLVDRIKTRYGVGIWVVGMTIQPSVNSTPSNQNYHFLSNIGWVTSFDPVAGNLKTVNDTIKASSRYNRIIDIVPYWSDDRFYGKPPTPELYPIGNVVGHPGNQDGVTTWSTIVLPLQVPLGSRIQFEYQPGLYTSRTIKEVVDNGNGTWTGTVNGDEVFATNVQDNAPLFYQTQVDGIHSSLHGILYAAGRIPQAEKAKFYP